MTVATESEGTLPKDAQSGAIRTLKKCGSLSSLCRSRHDIVGVEEVLGSVLPLQLTQLAGGCLHGELLPLDLGALQVLRLRFDRPLHAGGAKPSGRQLIALDLGEDQAQAGIRSHGMELPAAALFGLAAAGEIHLTTRSGAAWRC